MTTFPCQVGLICPFCHNDGDMDYCTYPDIPPKRRKEYQYILNMEELDCELIGAPDTPLGQLLIEHDKMTHSGRRVNE